MAPAANKPTTLPLKWQRMAEARCKEMGARLTPARLNAYAELVASDQPLSAYELVALLEQRMKKKIAPLTAYRHLDFLMKVGLVHRLESAQSYLPCRHPGHEHTSQYLLCSECGTAVELGSEKLANLLDEMAAQNNFVPKNAVVEVAGVCADCTN